MPKRRPAPSSSFVATARGELDSTLQSLGFTHFLSKAGEENKTLPRVLYRNSALYFEVNWDPRDFLLQILLGPRIYMQDVIERIIVHTHYAYYLEALHLDALPSPSQAESTAAFWRESFKVVCATLPQVVASYEEIRPEVERISEKRLPELILLNEWHDV